MNNKIFKKKLWEGLSVGAAALLVISCGGFEIAMANKNVINVSLGISTAEIIRSEDDAYQYFKSDFKGKDYSEIKNHFLNAGEKAEAEGLVLLKNDNDCLPLAKNDKVSTMLSGSNKFGYNTSGSSEDSDSVFKSFKDALTGVGLGVNEAMWNYYQTAPSRESGTSYKINEAEFSAIPAETVSTINEYSTVICTITRSSGEGQDITAARSDGQDKTYLSLNAGELSVLQNLKTLKEQGKVKKVIVLLNSSATIQLDFLSREDVSVDACLWIGNVGSSGIDAVAKTLVGEYNPSGKTSDTYLNNNFASPAAAQLKFAGRNNSFAQIWTNSEDESLGFVDTQKYYGIYNEGIYVGYRYFETRYYDYVIGRENVGEYSYKADVAYPFGYGLGYATFAYSDFAVEKTSDGYTVTVKVTNTSTSKSGKEAVLVYVQKPYTEYDKTNGVEKSSVELVGFKKTTDELAPGASATVKIDIAKDQLKSYDANKAKTYIEEEGEYYFATGNGAHEAVNNILASQGYTTAAGKMDKDGNANLAAKVVVADTDIGDYAVKTSEAGTKLAKSVHTGEEITNQFEDADLNKFTGEEKVKYASRKDWTGTFPSAKVELAVDAKMKTALTSDLGYEEDSNATMPDYGKSNGLTLADLRGADYNSTDWDLILDQTTFEEQTDMIVNGYFETKFLESVGKPNTAEADGPTAVNGSKGHIAMPSEGIWASSFNEEIIANVGDAMAEDARANDKTGLYAGGMNIHRMPFGGRSHEYFSEDPYLSGIASAEETKGMQAKGVVAHVKHLAFNDQEAQRNGISVWLNEQGAREIYLTPFEYALAPEFGNSHAVMTSFNRIGGKWAGAHKGLYDVIRDEYGFDGYAITDMASSNGAAYMTYEDGLIAGQDLWLGSALSSAFDGYKNSPTFANAMRTATKRILYVVANYSAAMNGITSGTAMKGKKIWWQQMLTGLEVGTGILTAGCAALWAWSVYLETKKK